MKMEMILPPAIGKDDPGLNMALDMIRSAEHAYRRGDGSDSPVSSALRTLRHNIELQRLMREANGL